MTHPKMSGSDCLQAFLFIVILLCLLVGFICQWVAFSTINDNYGNVYYSPSNDTAIVITNSESIVTEQMYGLVLAAPILLTFGCIFGLFQPGLIWQCGCTMDKRSYTGFGIFISYMCFNISGILCGFFGYAYVINAYNDLNPAPSSGSVACKENQAAQVGVVAIRLRIRLSFNRIELSSIELKSQFD